MSNRTSDDTISILADFGSPLDVKLMARELQARRAADLICSIEVDGLVYGEHTIRLMRLENERMRMALGAIEHLGTLQLGLGDYERGLAKGYAICGQLAIAGTKKP